jgi:aspartyl-tRNA(Asn)/glutamyl-tRNA(Gln) amidotransferase subunit A
MRFNWQKNITSLSILELQKAIEQGDIHCTDISHACIENQQRFGEKLLSYHHFEADIFRHSAKAAEKLQPSQQHALRGIPVSLKTFFAANGYQCFAGTQKPLPKKWQQPGLIVNKLYQQHCPISGLTQASEFAFGGLGINQHWGTPLNPWDAHQHRVPGGSSSGAALSVISGTAAFALGTDTGGSVRVPAACSGLVGLQISHGRWPLSGVVPLSQQFDSAGIICRSVADALSIFTALDKCTSPSSGAQAALGTFKVCIADDSCLNNMDDSLSNLFQQSIQLLCRQGMKPKEEKNKLFNDAIDVIEQGPNTAAIECSAFIQAELPAWRHMLSPLTEQLIESAESVTAQHYLLRLRALRERRVRATKAMQGVDFLLSPTLSITPPVLSTLHNEASLSQASGRMLRNTVVSNICGFCAITLPIGLDRYAMPVGLQIMAKHGEEMKLLHFAQLIEKHLGTGLENLGIAPLLR